MLQLCVQIPLLVLVFVLLLVLLLLLLFFAPPPPPAASSPHSSLPPPPRLPPLPLLAPAAEGLPRRAALRHHHAPEQGDPGAVPLLIGQPRLPAFALAAHQDVLLCARRVPAAAGRRPAGRLLCVLGLHGGAEGRDGAGHPGYAEETRLLDWFFRFVSFFFFLFSS